MASHLSGSNSAHRGSKRTSAQMPAKAPAKQAKRGAPAREQVEEFVSKDAVEFLKEHGVSKASYEPVVEVVKHPSSGLPKEVRDMLLAILPWSIALPADKRHQAQQEAVLMADGVVGAVQADLQRAMDVETINVDELKLAQADLEHVAEKAEIASSEACFALENQENNLAQAASMLVQAKETLQIAEGEEARLVAELSQTRSLLSEMEEVLSGTFKKLKNYEFENCERESLVQTVIAAGAKICLEESLVTALPICLAKRERQIFDQTVMSEAERAFEGKIVALGAAADADAALVETQAAILLNARAAVDEAVTHQTQEADNLCSAQARRSDAAAVADAAKIAVSEFGTKLAPALEVQRAKQNELDNFRSYNAFLFALLRDRVSKEAAMESVEVDGCALLPAALAGA